MAATSGGRDANRAQVFEDEKRRIIESCFNKRDEDGSILETYITHLRIVEYASHPTSPPPPQARSSQSEKPRAIIVAVRKSGRVRVHKSKENPNGTFSIGKTWNLEELTAIESYTSPSANAQSREWAGDIGFVVIMGKPYYWQAQTDKEKKFFIASLIKIYGKYTGGNTPELTGFDQREMDQVLGGAQRRPPQAGTRNLSGSSAAPPSRPSMPDSLTSNDTASPYNSAPGTAASNNSISPFQASASSLSRPLGSTANGAPSPAASFDSGRGQNANANALRRLAGNNKSQDSVANSFSTRSDDANSLRPRSRNGVNGGSSLGMQQAEMTPPIDDRPPERKRPPMDPLRPQGADRDLVPAPLMSPAMRREPVVPPRSMERASPRKDSASIKSEARSEVTRSDSASLTDRTATTKDTSRGDAFSAATTTPTAAPNGAEAADNAGIMPPPPPIPSAATDDSAAESPIDPDESRPGLGPMIKKKSKADIAGAFWKAATVASAFKPRPGGAGDRLRQAQTKSAGASDGISGVFPAPAREEPKPAPVAEPAPAVAEAERSPAVPEVKLTVPGSSRPSSLNAAELQRLVKKSPIPEPEASPTPPPEAQAQAQAEAEADQDNRRSIVAGNDVRYLGTLGIDASILDTRAVEFAKLLDYFGWVPGDKMRAQSFEEIKIDMDRELNRAQAGGWLARFQEEDERVDAIRKGIDTAMNECEELDNLLTLYSVELSTLSEDIAYIEAQGQGLQVQAANQKLLKKELESLLATCAITEADLEALRVAPLESPSGLGEIEAALVTLFQAMQKIDPAMGSQAQSKSEDETSTQAAFNSDYGKMRIVQEKKELYSSASLAFMKRLAVFMTSRFDEAFRETRRALDSALTKKADARNHDVGRDMLWRYSPLVLYAREVDLDNWNRLLQAYQDKGHPVYKYEFRDALEAWKRFARKPTGGEAELLFTHEQEQKQEGNLSAAARKLTVKRSGTLARGLRGTLGEGGSSKTSLDKSSAGDSRSFPYEVFMGVLDDLLPLVEIEQNFVADFFHATTLAHEDFAEAVAAVRPKDRRGGDLRRHRPMEPDRDLAKRVDRAMGAMFSFLESDLQGLIDWVLSQDALQGAGVLAHLERKMVDVNQSNQDFLNAMLQKLHGALEGRFRKFVDEQIRAIEDTKVKINKRKGVISFMRVFPAFSTAVETMLAGIGPNLSVRRTIDHEYDRILKAMFDSLKVIAREHPAVAMSHHAAAGASGLSAAGSVGAATAAADPEDKEALNFHILLIENMNHYLEEVDNAHGLEVLEDWRQTAAEEFAEHMSLYIAAVMRRPLGRLLEALENIEAQLAAATSSPAAIATQPSNSRAAFNRVLGAYDAREVRRGIETLRKRVEKHFSGDTGEDAGQSGSGSGGAGSRALVTKVLRECEAFYGEVEVRIARITTEVYGGEVLFEWPRTEVKSAFAAGGR